MNGLNLIKRLFTLFKSKNKKPDFNNYFTLYKKGKFQEAYTVLLDIIEKYPHFPKIGDLYLECADLELLVNDNVNKALEFLNKARESECHSMDKYYNCYGYVLCKTGKHEKGIEFLEKSVELYPKGRNLKSLGTWLSIFHDKRAISIWKKVLEEDPNSCLAQIYLAREESESGNKGKALLMLKKAEIMNPISREYTDIGRVYYEMDEYQSALNAYLQADKLGDMPKGPTYAAIASCYAMMGEDNLSKKYIQWAEQFNPENDYVQKIAKQFKELKK